MGPGAACCRSDREYPRAPWPHPPEPMSVCHWCQHGAPRISHQQPVPTQGLPCVACSLPRPPCLPFPFMGPRSPPRTSDWFWWSWWGAASYPLCNSCSCRLQPPSGPLCWMLSWRRPIVGCHRPPTSGDRPLGQRAGQTPCTLYNLGQGRLHACLVVGWASVSCS